MSQPSPGLTPTVPEERIVVLDVLRGFALLGILIMNMKAFDMPWSAWALEPKPFQGALDRGVDFVNMTLFAGKANAIFSLLFGVGMTIQLRRATSRGGSLVPMYLRRLAALFVIGALHLVFLWTGDVLHIYAALGLLLLAVRGATDRTILLLAAALLVAPLVRSCWSLLTGEPPLHPTAYYEALAREHIRVFQQGTYAEQLMVRLGELHEGYVEAGTRLQNWLWLWVSLAGTMLLGFWAGRRRLFEDVQANAATFRRLMRWCLGLGVAMAVAFTVLRTIGPTPRSGAPTIRGFCIQVMFHLHRPLLCVGYVAAISLLFQRERVRRVLMPLAYAGAMPLTNYLMQSVIATTLFYSHGYGLFATVGPALGLGIALAIFTVQLVLSRWWLTRHRFGPLEWLWRGATYGKLPALRA